MLSGGETLAYRKAQRTNARYKTRVEVWREGVRIDDYGDEGLPVFSGQVTATLLSQVTRQMDLRTDGTLFPSDSSGLLAPYGNELRAFMRLQPGASAGWEFPVFRGRINTTSLDTDDACTVQCVDRAADVRDAQFTAPENSLAGSSIGQEFQRLVRAGVPDAEFGSFSDITDFTPVLSWEYDRASACDDLALAASSYWYALADGSYVIRFVPWSITQTPIITLTDGPAGALTSAVPLLSREDVFNVVTVTGERADGSAPVHSSAYDADPTSPTWVGGGFGVRARLVNAQAAVTPQQALDIARKALRQSTALTRQWVIEMAPDPSLELGDCLSIYAQGLGPDDQVVSQFSLPLLGDQTMSVTLRAPNPNALQQEVE